jgi:peptidyl-prolyl cis-trans isomerase D
MLDAMRRGATGWLAKILFAVLVVSFAVWGIPQDFLGGGGSHLARVGSTTITQQEFQRAFQRELNQRAQGGQRMSTEDARKQGLDRYVLKSLVTQASVQQHTQELGLALPDTALAEELRKDEELKGRDGQFSRARFDALLEQNNLSEAGFFQIMRADKLRSQVVSAMQNATVVPPVLVDLQNSFLEETRVIEHATINPDKAPAPAAPDDAKLKETYERNTPAFTTPELRKIGVLLLSIDELKKSVTITDDEIKTAYEATKHTFEEPEKRRLAQITFKDKAAAEAAKKDIDGGKSFVDAAKDAGLKETDIDLGLKAKTELIEPKVADAVFALKKDEVSAVIESAFGPVLLRVMDIVPGKVSSLDEVKDKVRDQLAGEKASVLIQDKTDHVEEARNAGKTLKEIADEQKLTYVEGEVDSNNNGADGKPVFSFDDAITAVKYAFTLQQGAETAPVDLAGGKGYAWTNLEAVTPAAPKPLDAVKDQVKAFYLEQEKLNAISQLAAKLVERASSGEDMAAIAADAGGIAEATLPVTRMTSPQGLPRGAMAQAFSLGAGKAGSAETSDGKSRVVFRVKEIKPAPAPTKEQTERLTGELTDILRDDYLSAYVAALEGRQKPEINDKEFRRITGADIGDQ